MRGLVYSFTFIIFLFTAETSFSFCNQEPSLKSLEQKAGSLKDVPDNLALLDLTAGSQSGSLNFDHLRVLVWNLQKGENKDLYKDLKALSLNADLVLSQEAYLNTDFENFFCSQSQAQWSMASSFWDLHKVMTGVATGSRQNAITQIYLRSPDTEPVINTHKMSLVSVYSIPNSTQGLLVINIHGINFTGTMPFRRQITEILNTIARHSGPVIFAGDFNARNYERLQYLIDILGSLGLQRVDTGYTPDNFFGFLPFDHLFQRGFDVIKAGAYENTNTSDHKPLYFELRLKH